MIKTPGKKTLSCDCRPSLFLVDYINIYNIEFSILIIWTIKVFGHYKKIMCARERGKSTRKLIIYEQPSTWSWGEEENYHSVIVKCSRNWDLMLFAFRTWNSTHQKKNSIKVRFTPLNLHPKLLPSIKLRGNFNQQYK